MNMDDSTKIAMLRKRIFLTAYSAGSGHLASAFSIVEILYVLYLKGILKVNPKFPNDAERDRFILSKGHGSLTLYNVLCEAGFFTEQDLFTFGQPDSGMGGEPDTLTIPGVDASTGSLGHGLSLGVGMALAGMCDQKKYRTYVLVGDGECEEGSIWEGVMAARAYGLSNLTVILDNNRLQKMGSVQDVMGISSWATHWEAFGWQVKTVDGHNIAELHQALNGEWDAAKPHLLIANTVKGKGLSIMENNPRWHWRMPNKKELKVFMAELGITEEEIEACKRHI